MPPHPQEGKSSLGNLALVSLPGGDGLLLGGHVGSHNASNGGLDLQSAQEHTNTATASFPNHYNYKMVEL